MSVTLFNFLVLDFTFSVLTGWSRLKDVLLLLVKTIPDTLNRGKETHTVIQRKSCSFLVQLDKTWEGKGGYKHVIVGTNDGYICSLHFVGEKWGWQAYTTPSVHSICTFAIFFSVSWPFCPFTLVYEGRFMLCYKEKLEPLDHAMANVCMISAVICVSHW